MKNILFLMAVMGWFTSCGSSSGEKRPEAVRPQYLGDLDEKAQALYGKKYETFFYACDFQLREKILELAAAVEANRGNIVKLNAERLAQKSDVKKVHINGFDFLDLGPKKIQSDAWEKESISWQAVYDDYLKVKSNFSDPAWISINRDTRSLIVDDSGRIEGGEHPDVRRENEKVILSTFAEIDRCFTDKLCTSLKLSAEEKVWLVQGLPQAKALDFLTSEISYESKRNAINFLRRSIGWGAERFGFLLNSSITVVDSILTVPLDLSVFESQDSIFIQAVEKEWNTAGLNLKIINSKTGFKVNIDSSPGERAFVSYRDKKMQLYSPTKLTTVFHEFGHVLGLPDTYYTSFNQTSCEYVFDFNNGDIMSGSSSGSVLPTHTQKLKDAYKIK